MTATVPLRPVRRWIHRTQSAHRDRGETLGSLYFALLFVVIVGAMLHQQITAVLWPEQPRLSGVSAIALGVLCGSLLLMTLRRLGPVSLSRPAAYFLLTAPVSRRRLLLPAARLTAIAAALLAAAAGFAVVGHTTQRDAAPVAAMTAGAAVAGVALFLAAVTAQGDPVRAALTDRIVAFTLAAALAELVAEAAGWAPPTLAGWPTATIVVPLVGALTVLVTAGFLHAVRGLARTPNDRILESSQTAGTLFDAAFGMEPSWVADMVERRFWAHRRLRSSRPPARLPVLIGQDYLLARRHLPRLLWLTAATTLPLLVAGGSGWLLATVLPLGAMIAAGTTTATVKTDAGNPVLLRLLGLSSRQALTQRLAIPAVLATTWATLAMTLLQATGKVPGSLWWLLGLTLGPIGAAAAVRRARVGFVRNDLLPLDTPMGTVSTGPLLSSVAGPDLLILSLPTMLAIATNTPPTLTTIAIQAVVTALGVRAYVTYSTSNDRVDLTR
ncbi:DUF6297 family protein [Actinoplanes aureus]|uniref:Uncharacterized protein n=1 Tax=Actinoplanes aureus TaxID=2792083 RepID=A0A931G110_9ACTN|nr:DUF6297 family protein [Actinoplanes aureus]MBG0561914.1 hypothetical protein [Actinoplanes aureus]